MNDTRCILFSAEYTNLGSWKTGEKRYSEAVVMDNKIFHLYCMPDESEDVLKIFVRCNVLVVCSAIVSVMSTHGELIVFRVINRSIDGAMGTNIISDKWSAIKNTTSHLSQSGKLTFIIQINL